MANKRRYTIDEKIEAIKLYEKELNYSKVARLFNYYAPTVKYWVTHKENLYALYKTNRKSLYNYNGYKIKQEHTDFIVELYLSNPEISISQLAIALKNEFNLDVSLDHLRKVIKPIRGSKNLHLPEAQLAAIMYYKEVKNYSKVAKKYGIYAVTVKNWVATEAIILNRLKIKQKFHFYYQGNLTEEQLDFLKECLLKQSDITIKALKEALQKKFNVNVSFPHLRYLVKNLRE